MNIINKTEKMVDNIAPLFDNMTEIEKKAYELGVKSAINALDTVLIYGEYPIVHVICMDDEVEELSYHELQSIIDILDKENDNGDII